MREQQSFLSAVMGELSRRKVLRTLGADAVGVFVILQLMDAAVEPLRLPEWFPTLVVVTLILVITYGVATGQLGNRNPWDAGPRPLPAQAVSE